MEFSSFLIWMLAILLVYGLWAWWKDKGSIQRAWDQLTQRVRSGLKAASTLELLKVTQSMLRIEEQMESRLNMLEGPSAPQNQIADLSRGFEHRLLELEKSQELSRSYDPDALYQPRSIVRWGLRFTLHDSLWTYFGSNDLGQIQDSQLHTFVHGPFCRECLKRLVGRDQLHASAEIPLRCRHCGTAWDSQATDNKPVQMMTLKRQVFEYLDQEYHLRKNIQLNGP